LNPDPEEDEIKGSLKKEVPRSWILLLFVFLIFFLLFQTVSFCGDMKGVFN